MSPQPTAPGQLTPFDGSYSSKVDAVRAYHIGVHVLRSKQFDCGLTMRFQGSATSVLKPVPTGLNIELKLELDSDEGSPATTDERFSAGYGGQRDGTANSEGRVSLSALE